MAAAAATQAPGTLRRGQYAQYMRPGERLAVIDLGSNSFRLVVFMAGEGWWRRTDEIYEAVRIGEGLLATGALGEEPIERALATLDVFATSAARAGSAARRSTPSPPARSATPTTPRTSWRARASASGLPIRVLSREQEARYGYLAAVNSTTLQRRLRARPRRRLDAARARRRTRWRASSAPGGSGTVRMSERFLPPNGPAKRKQLRGAARARRRGARAGAVAGAGRATAGGARGHRRDGAQPRRRGPARGGPAVERRPGDGDRRARRSTSWSSGWPRCPRASGRASRASSRRART